MAVSTTTIWECRADASDTNGGGFNSAGSGAGTDYSQQISPQLSVTDAVANGTTTVTSSTGGFTSAHARNIAYIGGSWYEVVSVTDTNTITVDRTIATASGLTLNLGGALASPGAVMAAKGQANSGVVWIKNVGSAGNPTVYTIGGGTANTSGNRINETSTNTPWVGYATNRTLNNNDERPIIRAGANSITIFTMSAGTYPALIANLSFDNPNSYTSITPINITNASVRRCKIDMNSATGCKGITGAGTSSLNSIRNTSIWNCVNGASSFTGAHIRVAAINCSGGIAIFYGAADYDQCIIYNCSHVTYGFNYGGNGNIYRRCIVYNFTGSTSNTGFNLGDGSMADYCVVYSASGHAFGVNTGNHSYVTRLTNCAAGNMGTGTYTSANFQDPSMVVGFVTLTSDPFTNASNKDFSLNWLTGGGNAIKGIAYNFPDISTTTYNDFGAIQSSETNNPIYISY